MPNAETVLLEYQNRLHGLQTEFSAAHARQTAALAVLATAVLLFLLLCAAAYSMRRIGPLWFSPLALPVAALSRRFFRSRSEVLRSWRLSHFYQSGIDRLQGEWAGKGSSGEEFRPPRHLYGLDLNLFGAGSMFELLCTARTQVGRRQLAHYLLDLPETKETIARQQAVKELEPRSDLRERICLLGEHSFQECKWEPFREWLDTPEVATPRLTRGLMMLSSIGLTLSVLIPWLAPPGTGLWIRTAPYWLSLAAVQVALAIALRGRLRPLLRRTRGMGPELELLRQGLALLETQVLQSVKLRELAGRVKGSGAVVGRLGGLIRGVEQCDKQWFYAISRVLLVDTQLALAIERWKAAHKKDLADWLDAWGEFEALNALAGYAHQHPADVFPEMLQGAAEFDAAGLGHPLLPENDCVRNDVRLDSARRFYLVSGSNMSGKSTFLRAIGLNAVLGSMGAPVRAWQARQSSFAVCASISVLDSLSEGKSKFMAEVERMRQTLQAASGTIPVLFAFDEILSGTNSRDRRVAAESFLRALIGAGAIGALSTHDLALTEIPLDGSLGGCNVHMESRDFSDPLAFDYLVKPGVSTQSNALAILRMAGVAV